MLHLHILFTQPVSSESKSSVQSEPLGLLLVTRVQQAPVYGPWWLGQCDQGLSLTFDHVSHALVGAPGTVPVVLLDTSSIVLSGENS